MNKTSTRIPELDGLRGVAVLLVLVWHYLIIPLSQRAGAWAVELKQSLILTRSGVDLFFVLSGFLITGILLDNASAKNYLKVFYIRRAARILPAYAVLLSVPLLAGVFQYQNAVFETRVPFWAFATFMQNYVCTFLNDSGGIWLTATWSLAIEEQFYLFFPSVVRFVRKERLLSVFLGGIAIAILLRIFCFYQSAAHYTAAYSWTPCRLDALMTGSVIAYALRKEQIQKWIAVNRRIFNFALLACAPGLVILVAQVGRSVGYPMAIWGHTYLEFFYGLVLVWTLAYLGSRRTAFLRIGWLNYIGIISYGVYLFHTGILYFAFQFFGKTPILASSKDGAIIFGAFSLTVLLCSLMYQSVERKIIRMGHQFSYEPSKAILPAPHGTHAREY